MEPSSSRHVDLAIAGASFAGLACARTAATLGLETVVLEKKLDPGSRTRTTGILVKEAADAWDFPRRSTRRIRGVRVYAPCLDPIDLDSPGYYFLATDTPSLLRWMAAEAEAAGARILRGVPYREGWREDGRIRLGRSGISARFLAGCDGARSRVARDFGLGVNRRFLAGLELEVEGVRGVDPDRLHCFLDSRLAPGYLGWVVPGVGITQIGVACRHPFTPRPDVLLARVSGIFDMARARISGRRAGLIPVGGPVRPFAAQGVVLAGDAAGLVSPLTGGGIHTALDSGRLLGRAIAAHLLDGGPDPGLALAPLLPRFRWKRMLRAAIDLTPPNWLLDLLLSSPPLRGLAQMVFFHHRGLFSRKAWREWVAR